MSESSKKTKNEWETTAHAADGYVRKDDPLIRFRGVLDHAEAEVILTQTLVQKQLEFEEGRAAETSKALLSYLQEILDVLRAVMTCEYTGNELAVPTLFGYTPEELHERSHHAQEYYGTPTMTRPSYTYGEVYARLNLVRTELRLVESAAVSLFCEGGEMVRPDLLTALNRLSSAAHVLMCWWISQ